MKKILIALMALAFAGCQTSDEEIRADISVKAHQDLNFSGLNYTVKEGVVNFWGNCPSQKAFTKIKQTISNIHVIKGVNYDVTISPVVLDTLTLIKLQADSLLAKYPEVTAKVRMDAIVLKGEVPSQKKSALLEAFMLPKMSRIIDSVIVR